MAVGFGVGLVQKRHALEVHLPHLHDHGQQLLHTPVLADGKEAFIEEAVYLLVGIAQHHGVIGVGRHTPQAEKDQGFERTDVLVGLPELAHVVFVGSAAGRCTGAAIGGQRRLFPADDFNLPADGFLVEINIGQGGEQSLNHRPVGGGGGGVGVRCPGQANQSPGELILQIGNMGTLAADTGLSHTAAASGGLLALITKHWVIHPVFSFIFCPESVRRWKWSLRYREWICRKAAMPFSPRSRCRRSRAPPSAPR